MDSFEAFVAARGDALVRLAFVLTRDRHLAQDLVQDALARAHPRWAHIEQPEAYVRRGILNGFLSWRRRRSSGEIVTDRMPDGESFGSDGDPAALTVDRIAVLQLVGRLPRQQRAVIVLRYYEGLADVAIADLLGCSPSSVRSHAGKALANLRNNHADALYRDGAPK